MQTVKKVWGEERWIVNTDAYCGKILVLHRGYRCSLHHHKIKDETFYVLKGRVRLEVNGKVKLLGPGESQHIGVGIEHRFTGLEPSEMIEFSTHHDEADSYRSEPSGQDIRFIQPESIQAPGEPGIRPEHLEHLARHLENTPLMPGGSLEAQESQGKQTDGEGKGRRSGWLDRLLGRHGKASKGPVNS